MLKSQKLDESGQIKTVVGWFFTIALVAVTVSAYVFRQQLYDDYRLYNYVPPQSISSLALEDTMTPAATRIFYVNKPQLDNKAAFSAVCPNGGGEKTIVLGCYHGGQNGIFLQQITDSRLNGVVQVTAAHEMLHAAYDRLSPDEKKQIDAQLLNYYNNNLQDQRIKDTINSYRKSEPNDVVNEMHSIFGTEVSVLPSSLETYYKRYFVNRAKVTAYASQYQAEFSSRQATIKQDDQQLADLKQKIQSLEASLTAEQATITARQQELLRTRDSGNVSDYNAGVAGYNAMVDNYNMQARNVQAMVSQYNQLVAERNAVAAQIADLSSALSSSTSQIKQ